MIPPADSLAIIQSLFTKHYHLPKAKIVADALRAFSPFEYFLFMLCAGGIIISTLITLQKLNSFLLTPIPAHGGRITEGILGSPRFINPLLATSDTDHDLTLLVYSGLLRATPEGTLIPDLAKEYTILEDGLTYTFTLRPDALFHDGTTVTAEDVVFTIRKAQESALKSPRRANWEGVSVQSNAHGQVVFTLSERYAPFLENTTIGILPKHLWKDLDAEQFAFSTLNTSPVGSGPFAIARIKKVSSGVPESYLLTPFKKFVLGTPYIDELLMKFYPDSEALLSAWKQGAVDNISTVSPASARTLEKEKARIEQAPLPRIFAVFFNQNQAQIFKYKEVRQALDAAIDKQQLVDDVLHGYGAVIDGPIPPGLMDTSNSSKTKPKQQATSEKPSATNGRAEQATTTEPESAYIRTARALLGNAGWKFDKSEGVLIKKQGKEKTALAFSLSTSNAPELKAVVQILKETWEKLGARVDVKIFEPGDLNQNVIRPRKFDALLFGEVIGRDLDLFAFWHSSQMSDPGLNVAMYANVTADKLLESARTLSDDAARAQKYNAFLKEVEADHPAIFLYAPNFIYIVPKDVQGLSLGKITMSSERFLGIYTWYKEVEYVWNFFVSH